jgi:hypothetical protein
VSRQTQPKAETIAGLGVTMDEKLVSRFDSHDTTPFSPSPALAGIYVHSTLFYVRLVPLRDQLKRLDVATISG